MSIAIHGREELLTQVWADGDVEAIYLGDEQVWPSTNDWGGNVMIGPPEAGTFKHMFWLHAVDNSMITEASEENYLKFTIDGVDYYINSAPNGEQVVKLEGNILKLTRQQKEALTGKLMGTIRVWCKVPQRAPYWRPFKPTSGADEKLTAYFYLPMIPYSHFLLSGRKGRKEEPARVKFYKMVSLPSGKEIDMTAEYAATGSGRYEIEYRTRNVAENEVVYGDTRSVVEFNAYGSAEPNKGIAAVYGPFNMYFDVTIVSIF